MTKIIVLTDSEEEYGKDLVRGITRYSKDHGPWACCRMPVSYRDKLGMKGIVKWAKEWKANGLIGQCLDDDEAMLFTRAKIREMGQEFKERLDTAPNITGS